MMGKSMEQGTLGSPPNSNARYPFTQWMKISEDPSEGLPEGREQVDYMKGLNSDHAMERARHQYPGARIETMEEPEAKDWFSKNDPQGLALMEGVRNGTGDVPAGMPAGSDTSIQDDFLSSRAVAQDNVVDDSYRSLLEQGKSSSPADTSSAPAKPKAKKDAPAGGKGLGLAPDANAAPVGDEDNPEERYKRQTEEGSFAASGENPFHILNLSAPPKPLPQRVMDGVTAAAKDIGVGLANAPAQVFGGVLDFANNLMRFADNAVNEAEKAGLPNAYLRIFDKDGNFSPKMSSVEEYRAAQKAGTDDVFQIPTVSKGETVTGSLLRGITTFLIGRGGMAKAMGGGLGANMIASGVSGTTGGMDPKQERLANLVNSLEPNFVTEWLKASPEDEHRLLGNVKAGLEMMGLDASFAALGTALKWAKDLVKGEARLPVADRVEPKIGEGSTGEEDIFETEPVEVTGTNNQPTGLATSTNPKSSGAKVADEEGNAVLEPESGVDIPEKDAMGREEPAIKTEPGNVEPRTEEETVAGRREFLKKAIAVGAGAVVGKAGLDVAGEKAAGHPPGWKQVEGGVEGTSEEMVPSGFKGTEEEWDKMLSEEWAPAEEKAGQVASAAVRAAAKKLYDHIKAFHDADGVPEEDQGDWLPELKALVEDPNSSAKDIRTLIEDMADGGMHDPTTEPEAEAQAKLFDEMFDALNEHAIVSDDPKEIPAFLKGPNGEKVWWPGYGNKPSIPRDLTTMRAERDAGAMTDQQFIENVERMHQHMRYQAAMKEAGIPPDRVRGMDWIKEKLLNAVRNGQIDRSLMDLTNWVIDRNPNVVADLGIAIKNLNSMQAGLYNPASRVITLAKGLTEADDTAAVHEIMHHTERMLPVDVQNGIRERWANALATELKNAPAGPRFRALNEILGAVDGDPLARKIVAASFKAGILKPEDYHLVNPSEYWAVNATRILNDRYLSQESWVKRAGQWLKEFGEQLKGAVGMGSDSPILKGLKSVYETEGDFVPGNAMLNPKGQNLFSAAKKEPPLGEGPLPEDAPEPKLGDISEMEDDLPWKIEGPGTPPKRIAPTPTGTMSSNWLGWPSRDLSGPPPGPLDVPAEGMPRVEIPADVKSRWDDFLAVQKGEKPAPLDIGETMGKEPGTVDTGTLRSGDFSATGDNPVKVNVNMINGPDDLKQVIAEVSAQVPKQEVRPNEAVILGADSLGLRAEDFLEGRVSLPLSDSEVVALRGITNSLGQQTINLAKKAMMPGATDADQAQALALFAKFGDIVGFFEKAKTASGRSVQSFGIPIESDRVPFDQAVRSILDNVDPKDAREILGKLAEFDDPIKVARFISMSREMTPRDKFMYGWYNVMLGGKTILKKLTSDALLATWNVATRYGAEKLGSGAIAPGETGQLIYGYAAAFKDAVRLAGSSLRRGESQFYSQFQTMDAIGQSRVADVDRISAIANGSPEAFTADSGSSGAMQILKSALPTSWMGAVDDFAKYLNYRAEIRSLAYRDGVSKGLTDADLDAHVGNLMNVTPQSMHREALANTLRNTLQDPLTGIGADIANVVDNINLPLGNFGPSGYEVPLGRIIMPFIKIPTNIVRWAYQNSPLPLASMSSGVRQELAAGGARRDLAIARMTLGSAMVMGSIGLAVNGNITGRGPFNPEMRRAWLAAGNKPYWMKFGDWDGAGWNQIEPMGMSMGWVADSVNVMKFASEEDRANIATSLAFGIGNAMLSKTYMQSAADLMEAMEAPDVKGSPYFDRWVSGFVPSDAKGFRRAMDPWQRAHYELLDSIEERLPYLSQGLPPKRTWLGDPIPLNDAYLPFLTGTGAARWLSSIPTKSPLEHVQPVDRWVWDHRMDFPDGPDGKLGLITPGPIQRFSTADGKASTIVQLSPEKHDRLLVLAGNELKDPATGLGKKDALNALIAGTHPTQQAMWNESSNTGRAMMIQKIARKYTEDAKKQLMVEYKSLMDAVQAGWEHRADQLEAQPQ